MKIINERTKISPKLSEVCSKYGYELRASYWDKDDDALYLSIKPVKEYAPEIHVYKSFFDDNKLDVNAETISYGSLDSEEYDKFVSQINDTNKLVKYLSQFDFYKELAYI